MKRSFFRCLTLFLAFIIFAFEISASSYDLQNAVSASVSISAESYCLMDADSGDVIYAVNENQRMPMASTTKIMTCLVALEQGDIHSEVIIPSEAVGIEGSSMYLVKGEKLTLHELLYGLMLESANDAAVAIALHVSGSVEAFAECMNQKAEELGLVNSHFVNPNGLQAQDHYSSALDLSKLMSAAMQNELFAEISSTQTKNVTAPEGKTRFLSNHNRLLRSYEDCIGGKTGYTKTAGRCLVSVAKRDGKTLVCTTLGAPDDWQDHKQLFSQGFSLYDNRVLLEVEEVSEKVKVVGGQTSNVTVFNRDSFSCMLRTNEIIEMVVELPSFLYAPVKNGEEVGSVVFYQNAKKIGIVPLFATADCPALEVKLNFWQKLWNKICDWFR